MPEIIEKQNVGRIWNTFWDSEEGKLKGEVWIDIEKANKISPQIMNAIDRQLEISTAHWSDNDFTTGEWNGETYDSIARGIRPDHVALLPGQTGACSWNDGCGIRTNMKGGDDLENEKYLSPFFNETSHGGIRKQLVEILAPMENDQVYYFIRDVFDDRFVYVREGRDKVAMYQQSYSLEDDKVSVVGDPVEVTEKTEYVTLTANQKEEGKQMLNEKKCCPEKVAALISNEKTVFTDEHKDWLESMTEDQLTLLEPVQPDETNDEIDHFGQVDWAALSDDQVKLVAEKLNLKLNEAGDDQAETVEEYVSNAPEEMQEVLRDGLRMHKAKKTEIVSNILKNKRNKFTEDQLNSKDISELEALAELAQSAPPDFSLNSPSGKPEADEETLDIPSLSFDSK